MGKKPVVLIIRDGWGTNPGGKKTAVKDGNAVILANTPFTDEVLSQYPHSFLSASGMDVGLPEGQMGNSEVGHLNLGAGRIVYQISPASTKPFPMAQSLTTRSSKSLGKSQNQPTSFHRPRFRWRRPFPPDQLIAMTKLASQAGVKDIFIHAITDGRDTSPTGGAAFISKVEDETAKFGAKIATVVGRYFAMDRDKRWDRVKLARDAIVHGIGVKKISSPPKRSLKFTRPRTKPMNSCPP